MAFVYHLAPRQLIGEDLHPLHGLKKISETAYHAVRERNAGKGANTKRVIPKLNCLWNDVVHFAPIHPHHVFKALLEMKGKPRPGREFYRIPLDRLIAFPAVVFSPPPPALLEYAPSLERQSPLEPIAENQVEWLAVERYTELSKLPDATLNYFRWEVSRGRIPQPFLGMPLVLVQGSVSLRGLTPITWEEEPVDHDNS